MTHTTTTTTTPNPTTKPTTNRTTRPTAALLALGVTALAGCGGVARPAAEPVPATAPDTTPLIAPETAPPTTVTTAIAPAPQPAPTLAPAPPPPPPPATTAPPPPAPPPPATTAPPPPPPPSTTAPPPPRPEPVEVELLSALEWDAHASRDDGAGGSAQTKEVGTTGVGLRAYAWHGYNGSGTARATATTTFDASPYLTSEVPVALVEVTFAASGSGVLKAPWDRAARIWVDATSTGAFSEGPTVHTFIDVSLGRESEINSELDQRFDNGGTHRFLVTPSQPQIGFTFDALCTASGGPMALALLNEGYCDFYEAGGLQLDRLSVVVTPLPGYQVVDGRPVG